MSVVGIDIGNENCVVAVAKQRGIDIALNEESRRETPAMVYFGDKQRFLGTAAASSAMMNWKSTISQIKRLIGRKIRDPEIQHDLKVFPYQVCEGQDEGILINVKDKYYSPTQILGMLLSHLKNTASKALDNQVVSNCVIGIPVYFTDLQRRAYLDAAAIAKLNPLRLMQETAAIALAYGIYKTDLPSNDPMHVVFVDIGHCDTQVSVVAFRNGHLKVISHAYDQSLGGRDFDEVLFHHFATNFKEEHDVNVAANPRASSRLRSACEKLKKVLSANTEAPLSIECLIDEKDVKGFIKRDEFENLSSSLLERLKVPCRRALEEAELRVDDIDSIEVTGSGSRIPAILKILREEFKKEPSRTLNASECIARGCALQCAMLSPSFRVREFEVEDTYPFSIDLYPKGPNGVQQNPIKFPKGCSLPTSKILELRRGPLTLDAYYGEPKDSPYGKALKIGTYTIGPAPAPEKAKIKINLCLNLHGLMTVNAFCIVEDDLQSTVRATSTSETDKRFGVVVDSENHNSEHDISMKGRPRRFQIPVNEHISGVLAYDVLYKYIKYESELERQDRIMEETKDKKNAVESYVYDMRNKLEDKYQSYAKDGERQELSAKLQQTEEWLYAEGGDQTKGAYVDRLKDLKKIGDPIEKRFKEEESRKQRVHELERCIVHYRQMLMQPKYAHIDHADKEKILYLCNEAENWLKEKLQGQNALPKSEDPILLSSDICNAAAEVQRVCTSILFKPKPMPQKPNQRTDSKQTSSTGSDGAPEPMDTDNPDGVDNMHTD